MGDPADMSCREENNVDIKCENVTHCSDDCKYDDRDEEYEDMIESCLCKSGIAKIVWG